MMSSPSVRALFPGGDRHVPVRPQVLLLALAHAGEKKYRRFVEPYCDQRHHVRASLGVTVDSHKTSASCSCRRAFVHGSALAPGLLNLGSRSVMGAARAMVRLLGRL
jgi:hypothetical protein